MADQTRQVQVGDQVYEVPADAGEAHISAAVKAVPAANAGSVPSKARTWTDVVVDAIPGVTGTAGAALGGAGGSFLGFGFGGIPGAAGGAALGAGAGEAARQLINRARGAEAPNTPGEAATQIAIPATEAAATTAVLGGAGKLARPYLGAGLQKAGQLMESPKSIRQLAGQGVSAAGRAIESADAGKLTQFEAMRIRTLMDNGMSQSAAVRTVWNDKLKALAAAAVKP